MAEPLLAMRALAVPWLGPATLTMSYWIYIDTETGRQVEWSDEFSEWTVVGTCGRDLVGAGGHPVDLVRVELTEDRRPPENDENPA